ncbi:MAG: fold hydrolase [Oscillospiraceae bacterium]|nr:fold hydrolase [Oscillospiraceae bacterium]
MKLTFFGAAKSVTGSCHCLDACGKRVLIDCGLQQGGDELNNGEFDFAPNQVDDVIVTHAHIDHSGRLPLLVKQGFSGPIHCTRMTARLLSIMLRDSAHIQESEAEWKNQKSKRAGKETVEPIYTIADAEAVLELLEVHEYQQRFVLEDGIEVCFQDAGHLLGSAFAEVWVAEDSLSRKIVFSGDVGNVNQTIIRDPQVITEADFVVMESTYGDRNHETVSDYTEALARIIEKTFDRGGNVVIPSFAVGRTQELLYAIREMKERKLVKSIPDFMVCVDSPLASEATKIYSCDLHGYLDDEALALVQRGEALFTFQGLRLVETPEESKALNEDKTPKVIISASGMCDAGRIRHHLKHNLWRRECSVVFVGHQAEGSLGRLLINGAQKVKLFGEEIAVWANIINFKGLSSHADRDHLLEWIGAFSPKPRQVFVVHGERGIAELFSETLRDRGFAAHAPESLEVYDLAENQLIQAGIPRLAKTPAEALAMGSPAFRRLEDTGRRLMDVITRNKGGTNKDLGKFADQLRALIEKWDR